LWFISEEEIDPSEALTHFGMDSMLGAELRNWIFKNYRVDISYTELLEPSTTLQKLSMTITKRVEHRNGEV
jgi:aryl carrier-like protein